MTTEEQRREAVRLREVWERLGRTHMMAGGGCACGVEGVVVALEDFEQDIADYLHAESERLGRPDVGAYIEGQGREGELWSIPRLLNSIGTSHEAAQADVAAFILERLGRTLQSFEKLHGAG